MQRIKFKPDSFVLAIIMAVLLAYFFPQPALPDSGLPLDLISSIGVAVIFFFYGVKLSPSKIKSGLQNWKLHLLVQGSTFLLFPLIILLFYPLASSGFSRDLWLAFLFLAALPSTVSSSVVLVSMAKGNVPAAIFNASLSGLIGVLLTPLWMGLFIKQTVASYPLSDIYIKLLVQILLPVIAGILLQSYLGKLAGRYSRQLVLFDRTIILLIIYNSFAVSFKQQLFRALPLWGLVVVIALLVILFFLVFNLIGFIARKLNFSRQDRITAQFCGTKKSVIHGTVFARILFPPATPIGIILLPLMIFHAMQIFIISVIAAKLNKNSEGDTAA